MLKNIKFVLRNSLIYGFGNLSTKLVGFVLLPLYTKYLTVSDYGILAILEISLQLVVAVFGLKIYSAFFRWYWDKEYLDKQKSIFFTSFLFLIFISLLMVLGFLPLSNHLSFLLFDNSSYSYLLSLMFLSAGLQIVAQMPLTLMRLQEKPILFSVANIIRLMVILFVTIYFIVYLDRNVNGIYEAQLIGQSVYFLFVSKYIWKNIEFKFQSQILWGMLNFSFPLIFAEIAGVVFSITSRYCLKFLTTLSEVGIFSLGFKMANTIKVFVVTSVMLAITPIIYKKMNDPDNKRFYSKIMTYFAFGIIICVLGMSFFGKEIIKLLARKKDYWDAYKVIPFISFGILFGMLRDIAMTGLHIKKKTKNIALLIGVMAVLNLILNLIFIPLWQSLGAALATLIAQITFFLFVYINAKNQYYIPYELHKIFKMLIVAVVLFGISLFTNDLNLFLRILFKSILIISFPFILYFFNFYEPIELQRIKEFVKKIICR